MLRHPVYVEFGVRAFGRHFQHVQHELVTVREEYELEITQLVEKHAMDLLHLKDEYERPSPKPKAGTGRPGAWYQR